MSQDDITSAIEHEIERQAQGADDAVRTQPPTVFAPDPAVHHNAQLPTVMLEPPAPSEPTAEARASATGTDFVPFGTAPGAAAVVTDDPELFVGQELGGYTIKRKLAEGGMGVVFEGVHGKIGRRGAIKVLKLELCRSEEVIERFHQEARAVNSIRHENIVDIYDFGRDPYGRAFFVMEFLEGEPLSARIRRGALPWSEAFPILEQTLRALKAAHDKGFVHRDLKPDNIWLKYVDGQIQVKLLDFGIAKLVGSESPREKLTQTGAVIGTPHYMSPEQINGSRDVDHRTDIYALGVITYEMFTGKTPFVGDTLQAIMTGHLFREAPRLAAVPEILEVPALLAEIVERMLVKDATARYESAADVLADLHDVNQHQRPARAETLRRERPTRAPLLTADGAPAPAPTPTALPRRRSARGIAIGALAAAGVLIAAAVIWRGSREAPSESAAPAVVERPTPPEPSPAPSPEPPLDYDVIRHQAQAKLRAGFRHVEPKVRVQSANALGKLKDQPAVPMLTSGVEGDADLEVRARAAVARGTIGATAARPMLGKLERAEPAPLKIWLAVALARLGDRDAKRRLLRYVEAARRKEIGVAFWAALELAEISQPGDRQVIGVLKAIAAREAELQEIDPYAGAHLLASLVALRYAPARKALYGLLEDKREGVRIAAAEGLARLGDDTGRRALREVFESDGSPNRLAAAVALIPLGDYSGVDLITSKLGAKDPETQRLAARALGEIGEPASLRALQRLASEADWTLAVAASAALVAIVGLDPAVLAQSSVDWTRSALESRDWAVRTAAAGVLANIPEKQAVPLLAQAIVDPEPKVRAAAAKAAGKMKSPEAAQQVAASVKTEADPEVKEQQVKALGEIGSAVARDTLVQIADQDAGRVGLFAAGSLIALGDPAGKDKLEAAVVRPEPALRLAAVEAAATAKSPLVLPTLKLGVMDRVFGIRFAAAEGLAALSSEKDAAIKVLKEALQSKEVGVLGRAMAALVKLGEAPAAKAQTPAEMVESPDPKRRLAAVPIVRALPVADGVPLLRRLLQDQDPAVRRASVDAIEDVASQDKDQAIKLYKPLARAADPVVRSKALGQLARLVPPPPPPPAPPPPAPAPAPAPARAEGQLAAAPPRKPVDDSVPKVKVALAEATAASTAAESEAAAFGKLVDVLAEQTGQQPRDDDAVRGVEKLAATIEEAAIKIESVASRAEAAATVAADAAGPSPSAEAQELVATAREQARSARATAQRARGAVPDAMLRSRQYVKTWTQDAQMLINTARAAMVANHLTEAQENLDKAARQLAQSGGKRGELDGLYVELFATLGDQARDPTEKIRFLHRAKEAFARLERSGTPEQVQEANAPLMELADEIMGPGAP